MEEKENKRFKQKAHDKHFITKLISDFITELTPEVSDECERILDQFDAGNDVASVKADVECLYSQYPDNYEVNFLKGVCCIKENQLTDAIAYFEKSVQIFPYFSEAIYNLGCLYRKEARIPEGVDCFKQVLEIEE